MEQLSPIEGFFIQSTEGLIFDVKGISHPKDRVIAFVRYIPPKILFSDPNQRKGYSKIFDLRERYKFLLKHFPDYLFNDPKGRGLLQAVPLEKIDEIFDPRKKLQELFIQDKKNHLISSTLELTENIRIASRIESTCMGISGSLLVDLATETSDIDLVIYGLENGKKVFDSMNGVFSNSKQITRYSEEELFKLWNARGQTEEINFQTFFENEKRKNLQGKINGIDFYIRLVPFLQESYEIYEDITIEPYGELEIEAEIINDSLAIFTPCIYDLKDVKNISGDKNLEKCLPARIYSVRGRYCEIAVIGETILAKGKLERVTTKEGIFYQLVLGTTKNEYFCKSQL
ncbi:MAG: hypothetical protein ACFFDW_17335 [Candidatus Thorarchaeota archaeon]